MAVQNGVGISPATRDKQQTLNKRAAHIVSACYMSGKNWNKPVVICDANAGPGRYEDGTAGSPLIFAQHISVLMQQFGYRRVTLHCAEKKPALMGQLKLTLAKYYPDVPVRYFTDQADALQIPEDAHGVAYFDPNGYSRMSYGLDAELLAKFGLSHTRMDILMTRECQAFKRMIRAAHCKNVLSPQEYAALTGKRFNYVRQYSDHHWWTFLFSSNWEKRDAKKLGMDDVLSPAGQRTLALWTPGMRRLPAISQEELPWGA